KPQPFSVLKNLTVPAIAIGKLLSPWLLRRRPPRRDGSAGHSRSGKAAASRPPLIRRPPQEAERQSQRHKSILIQGCGKAVKLIFVATNFRRQPNRAGKCRGRPATVRRRAPAAGFPTRRQASTAD